MAVTYVPSPTLELNCPLVEYSLPTIGPATGPTYGTYCGACYGFF